MPDLPRSVRAAQVVSEMERFDEQLRAREERLKPAASLAVIVVISLVLWVPIVIWIA